MRDVIWMRLVCVLLGLGFGACADRPLPEDTPAARLVVGWDPLECGPPHRVVLELSDDTGEAVSKSAPCEHGELTVDMPSTGAFRGHVYGWTPDDPDTVAAIDLAIDVAPPVTTWTLEAVP